MTSTYQVDITERKYLAGWSGLLVGQKLMGEILAGYGSAALAWQSDLGKIKMLKEQKQKLIQRRDGFALEKNWLRMKELNITVITIWDREYPYRLKTIDTGPFLLYVMGSSQIFEERAVLAVVGTRKPTSYGAKIANRLVSELAGMGIVIVSGLAYGIDTIAHKQTLNYHGITCAVLANGLDRIYPGVNNGLARNITVKGALVSEYGIGTEPLRQYFPARNRIISGLADAVLVVEGEDDSGSLITAKYALKQNRCLMAVPGPVDSSLSFGPNELIKQGAVPVTHAKDVVDALAKISNRKYKFETNKVRALNFSDVTEEKFFHLIDQQSLSLDDIAKVAAVPVQQAASILTMMEIRGLIINGNDGKYRIK
jgi:DNA processing protein